MQCCDARLATNGKRAPVFTLVAVYCTHTRTVMKAVRFASVFSLVVLKFFTLLYSTRRTAVGVPSTTVSVFSWRICNLLFCFRYSSSRHVSQNVCVGAASGVLAVRLGGWRKLIVYPSAYEYETLL